MRQFSNVLLRDGFGEPRGDLHDALRDEFDKWLEGCEQVEGASSYMSLVSLAQGAGSGIDAHEWLIQPQPCQAGFLGAATPAALPPTPSVPLHQADLPTTASVRRALPSQVGAEIMRTRAVLLGPDGPQRQQALELLHMISRRAVTEYGLVGSQISGAMVVLEWSTRLLIHRSGRSLSKSLEGVRRGGQGLGAWDCRRPLAFQRLPVCRADVPHSAVLSPARPLPPPHHRS